jgi:hypothetical protein
MSFYRMDRFANPAHMPLLWRWGTMTADAETREAIDYLRKKLIDCLQRGGLHSSKGMYDFASTEAEHILSRLQELGWRKMPEGWLVWSELDDDYEQPKPEAT